ncbi:hypothetical protein N5U04_11130 [Aliarcobacter butzleri]|uniref:hypothetical protein n=1 Tax=Aliarcobacter butzleri TaxID=28197 RepID=UPI0021B257F8|nr:hypothetical protein [Aliarcobacter butzleri]MCT7549846.1 hypothetical protein [Aliarcobacter butzleri]MCT7560122.1 hypothetical protein [Aliarcobacter butzleri]
MLKLAYISKKILVALEPLDISLARFVKYSLADLNILIISMLNNQPKALNWAFFIFIKFTKWIFRDKGEIMEEEFIKLLMEETNCDREYAKYEWNGIVECWGLDLEIWNAEDLVNEVISNWSV